MTPFMQNLREADRCAGVFVRLIDKKGSSLLGRRAMISNQIPNSHSRVLTNAEIGALENAKMHFDWTRFSLNLLILWIFSPVS